MVSTRSSVKTAAVVTAVASTSGRPTKRAKATVPVTENQVHDVAVPELPLPDLAIPLPAVAKKGNRKNEGCETRAPTAVDGQKEGPAEVKKQKARKKVQLQTDPATYAPRVQSSWKIGAHVSAAGGVENAVLNAASIGYLYPIVVTGLANAFALFLKSQRKWVGPPQSEESRLAFVERLKAFGYEAKHVLPHGNYLVNMGNPDAEVREKSYACFVDELKRCEALGLTLFNFHPGSTVGACTVKESLKYIADCINRAHQETQTVCVVIENMAGAGNVVGGDFAHIAEIIEQVEDKSRVGVCLDTCHAFATGYDIRTSEGWKETMAKFDAAIGMQYLRGMHLNDSKAALGTKKDRHDNLGRGEIGLDAFSQIVSDPCTRDIPLILETPSHDSKDGAVWRAEIAALHAFVPDCATEKRKTVAQAEEEVKVVVDVVVKAEAEAKSAKEKKRGIKRKMAARSNEDEGDGEDDEDK
ncbi:AP endonuclease [Peniophora sp. CONT]|nr:AP endonuclease [Peniophora sp. CONT]